MKGAQKAKVCMSDVKRVSAGQWDNILGDLEWIDSVNTENWMYSNGQTQSGSEWSWWKQWQKYTAGKLLSLCSAINLN